MSDPVESGESGVAAGVGQKAEADSEPPQSTPHLPQGYNLELGVNLEEETPSAAKQPRLCGEGLILDPYDTYRGPIEQARGGQEVLAVLNQDGGKLLIFVF